MSREYIGYRYLRSFKVKRITKTVCFRHLICKEYNAMNPETARNRLTGTGADLLNDPQVQKLYLGG